MPDFPDLYALVIRLRPERGGAPPGHAAWAPLGHAAQALFLDLLRQVDPQLAAALHAEAHSKPFTVAVLPRRGSGARGQASGDVELRVAFTRADMFPAVTRALLQQLPGDSL